jgi:glucosylglycerate phosphorylase
MTLTNELEMKKQTILTNLMDVYGKEKGEDLFENVLNLINTYGQKAEKQWVNEKDVMLITYGDSIKEEGKAPLKSLHEFLNNNAKETITNVHLLPFYPYSSDDGFSVIDYEKVNSELGDWEDVQNLSNDYSLMFDGVINHISKESDWFQEYLKGNPLYKNYFVEADPNDDYSTVTRPRALPLLTKFETANGEKYVWTTFSDDQIDLNYENENVLLNILEILLMYVQKGARFLRLDAIGFMWKKFGTTCIHLEETHKLVQVMRDVLEAAAPGTIIITETNVPHKENISYFGNGHNEAHMVYQFPLPPLTLHTLQTGNAEKLLAWADSLEPTTEETTFFNFLASHDGIGVRPVEGILTKEEVGVMVEKVTENGGFVSYKANGDGTKSPYELNINYLDALSHPDEQIELKTERFIAAQSILLSMQGVPGIYVHSLLGSQNDLKGVEETGRYRSINREKLNRHAVQADLNDANSLRHHVFTAFSKMIKLRQKEKAFHPNGEQQVVFTDERLFSLLRTSVDKEDRIAVVINVSNESVSLNLPLEQLGWKEITEAKDIVSEKAVSVNEGHLSCELSPYQVMWIKK